MFIVQYLLTTFGSFLCWEKKSIVDSHVSLVSLSSRTIYLPHHHVPTGQEHALALGNDQGAAAGEGERGVHDGAAQGDAGDPRQAAGAAEAAAGPGAEAAGTDAGDRRTEHTAGRTGAQAA